MAAISDARKKANDKYIKEKCDEIKIRVPKGKKEIIQNYAKSKNTSVNNLVNKLLDEEMKVYNQA